ncbi:IS200/IS605 family transposase [uncultured Draconibacterium sp.]|uniref:IS200/IS605 family transposase n=1 Tax=uncultured Draconibacterium sp. TaxID=1573823 RepID=UPI0037482F8B
MSYVRNWLHCVWGTKSKFPLLTDENKQKILDHILANAKTKGIFIYSINGSRDHVHCLISLLPDQNITKVIQLIKGESSYWVNKENLCKNFKWADGYFAVSISESQVEKVKIYIQNQEIHHKKKSWEEEYNEFIKNYNFENS